MTQLETRRVIKSLKMIDDDVILWVLYILIGKGELYLE